MAKTILPLLLLLPLTTTTAYEIGCLYPRNMLQPFDARAKIIGFTSVYNAADAGLETPIAIHQAQAFSYCDVNCLAHHDDKVLNAITKERPRIVVPKEMGHNSWSRMLCITQCYGVLFEREGNVEALTEIEKNFRLTLQPTVESNITDYFVDDYYKVEDYIASREVNYDPLAIGRLVVHEILRFTATDGWNSDGSHRYDPISRTTVPCTSNCMPYTDTYGYYPRNTVESPPSDTDTSKYIVDGKNQFWQPLLESDGRGYFSRQEHVTPHIGFHAKYTLRNPTNHTPLPSPNYNFRAESLLVLNRLRDSAADPVKWDKIAFYDKKFLVRLLLQESIRDQFKGVYTFEDELLFTHGISAAEYDSVLAAWREKVRHDLVRPTTVIQRWGEELLEGAFDGVRDTHHWEDETGPGLKDIRAGDMHAFVRVMPHSEYPSGSSCICAAYREFTELYLTQRFGAGAAVTDMYWGYNNGEGVDFGCEEMSLLDPVRAGFLGCKHGGFAIPNMEVLARECGESRLWGGMHFTDSVPAGVELCGGLGTLGVERVEFLRNGSELEGADVRGAERPVCSTDTEGPTDGPTKAPSLKVVVTDKVEVIEHDHDDHPGDHGAVDSGVGRVVFGGVGVGVALLLSSIVLDSM